MFRYSAVFLLLAILPVAYNQFITFKDGKIGVNFFGYTAEAGLGGLLTGNAAHGGLSASAGTPFGQRAAAGLGGTIDEQGRPRGGGFAAATAGAGVGASAALGGNVNEHGGQGGLGSEAHAAGYSAKRVGISQYPQQIRIPENVKSIEVGPLAPRVSLQQESAAQSSAQFERRKLKTKYIQQQNDEQNQVKTVTNEIIIKADSSARDENNEVRDIIPAIKGKSTVFNSGATTLTRVQPSPNFFNDIFNIPISALTAVNQFLNGLAGTTVTKTTFTNFDHSRH